MRRVALMLIAVGLMSAVSKAALLGVVQNDPDILASFITVEYNSTTDVFTASGFPESLDLPGGASPDFDLSTVGVSFTSWLLTMNVDSAGVMSSGSISIGGVIPGFGTGPILLTGSLDAYGSVALIGDDKFDFIFTTTGGDLASIFGPKFGVLLDAGDSSFTGSFATDFDNLNEIFGGIADTSKIVVVPSPMAAPAGLIMLGLLSGFRRCRDRQ